MVFNTRTHASLHLPWSELACHDRLRTPPPLDYRTDPTRLPALIRAFEDVREECTIEAGMDCPVYVLEAFRTPEYQEVLRQIPRLKAAKHSQHCELRAIDGTCRLLTFEQFAICVKRAASRKDSPIRYIEYRPSMHYIHFDVRPTETLVEETIE